MAARSTAVKWFTYQHQGAPTLTGAAGSILEILHACLVTGFGATPVDSITRDGSTVTVTISAGHGFVEHQVVRISGCDQQEYNGDWRIDTVTNDTFTFELPDGMTPATPATGTTLEAKAAPAGWERSFVSGDQLRAAFRSTAPEATGFYLYVDDTNAWPLRAGAKGYEMVTDIDTRSGPFPWSATDDQWVWWLKGWDVTTARPWAVIADSRLFYVWVNADSSSKQYIYAFGDIIPFNTADVYGCVVAGHGSSTDNNYCGGLLTITQVTRPASGSYIARDIYGYYPGKRCCISSVDLHITAPTYSKDSYPRALGSWPTTFPCPTTKSVILSQPILVEPFVDNRDPEQSGQGCVFRGNLPGLFAPLHDRPYSDLSVVTDAVQVRPLLALKYLCSRWKFSYETSGPRQGQVMIDITGPWRE
jgi:hypothetical protein